MLSTFSCKAALPSNEIIASRCLQSSHIAREYIAGEETATIVCGVVLFFHCKTQLQGKSIVQEEGKDERDGISHKRLT